jgi:hypothetical protein
MYFSGSLKLSPLLSFLPSSAIDFLSCGFRHREVLNTVVVVAAVAGHLAFAQRPFFLWLLRLENYAC